MRFALFCLLFLASTSSLSLATPVLPHEPRQFDLHFWAPFASSTIHPGVNALTSGSCTANFIFVQGSEVYIGQAAHCASRSRTETNGCRAETMPEGTRVIITGASAPGRLVYSSWDRMKRRNEQNDDVCGYNDLALVRIDPRDHARVNPSLPRFGGPTGLRTDVLQANETIYGYGNSTLRMGKSELSPKFGRVIRPQGNGWSYLVQVQPTGIPGDSGSGFIDREGKAFGVLATLQERTRINGIGNLDRELEYARTFSDFANLQLVLGTEPFNVELAAEADGLDWD
ncbi:uncharacterized protein PSFLO_00292 [Pseudozyma flocculosa]|uniref:Serine protease n=2 Tax=Pseudozyma flocculosa TaxID=84751 RepID=A0A5C3EUS8_9BASI|nr:uncharacterized protein PSFLO_00292 [Pseudozyma flocculosa]